ncbi:MAG: hypothetical protein B7Y15_08385 [Bacteroidetes bacterium 24-39-8]|jgi:hypothetical protein|nr:MAG: hypothetical protein B7Y69_06835 [Sphingobacteriia bacterium 35-40-8]OYZ50773.1 MAG: hypothetical protein B7Y15_08385 [Bacteroidetes bacterium 24-39-8]HQS54159.1 DUF2911 domain-containing protein [Sediminibacterium sp.]
MKKILLLASMAWGSFAFAQINMPAPSSTQTITQDFGMGKITLVYSRPNIKGRSLLKDNSDLAPLGKIWRLGANAATKVKFTDNVTIGGKLLDTGSYVLYAIPGKEYWDIVVNKGLNNWGTDGYKESEDVVRVKVKAEKSATTYETLTMQLGAIQAETCEINILWGNTQVRIPVSTNITSRLKAQIEKALDADKVNPAIYQTAANFYYEMDKDITKALANAKKATVANPNAFWLFLLQAKIEKESGDKVAAKASAEKCISLATTAKNDDYVKMAKDLIKSL